MAPAGMISTLGFPPPSPGTGNSKGDRNKQSAYVSTPRKCISRPSIWHPCGTILECPGDHFPTFRHPLATPWAPHSTLWARSSKNHQGITFWDLIVESFFELKIDIVFCVFLKVHLGGLARLLAPKRKPNCFKMDAKMEPDGELMQNCKTLIWACIYHVLARWALPKSNYFSLHFSVLGGTLSREGSGRRLFWISVILGSILAVHFRHFLAYFSGLEKGGREFF